MQPKLLLNDNDALDGLSDAAIISPSAMVSSDDGCTPAVSVEQFTQSDKEQTMGFMKILGVATVIALLAGCSSPQDRAAKAQEGSYDAQKEVAQERLSLVNKYQQCVKEAGDNQQKAAACDSYLKAAEALK